MNAKLSSLGLLTTVVLLAGANQANASGYTFTDLTTLVGGDYSVATAINNAGQVVGSSNSPHATTWNGTTATDLGTLGGNYSAALAINNTGQVAGHSDLATPGSASHATLWGNDGTSPSYSRIWCMSRESRVG
jgi:probable HAF family extracellular repeat protein